MPCGNISPMPSDYLVFYRVTAEGVFVDRILYKKRDYLPLLGLQ